MSQAPPAAPAGPRETRAAPGARRWRRRVAALYLLLLAGSWLVSSRRARSVPAPDDRQAWVPAVGSAGASAPVHLVYRDRGASQHGTLPVLLLHGSPGRMADFRTVAPVLEPAREVLIPDLPGFGQSTRHIPDYSLRAHATYLLALLDRLGLGRVHVVGYSMGGGVALEMAGLAPERIASLTLLASIGLQEFELTGHYGVNHLLHGVQLGAIWAATYLVPHFGWMNDAMLDVSYARNFFDSDQRPLRGILQHLQMPVLILHGPDDVLVPYEAAVEHHRLVPQSELRPIAHGHFAPFVDGAAVGTAVAGFLDRVEHGAAPTRATAEPARRDAALRPSAVSPRPHGFGLLVSVVAGSVLSILVLAAIAGLARTVRRLRSTAQTEGDQGAAATPASGSD